MPPKFMLAKLRAQESHGRDQEVLVRAWGWGMHGGVECSGHWEACQ